MNTDGVKFNNRISELVFDKQLDKLNNENIYTKLNQDSLFDLDTKIKNNQSIDNVIITQINLDKIEPIVNMFEERYKSSKLFDVDKQASSTNKLYVKSITKTNEYNLMLVMMGVISIIELFRTHYINIVSKINSMVNTFNATFTVNILDTINDFINNNIIDIVRMYYNIKLDQFESSSVKTIDDTMYELLNTLSTNGHIETDSKLYNNINQFVNPYMTELIGKTLQYNTIIIDDTHKWIVNLYQAILTLNSLVRK